jgi:hypothetical protein
MTDYLRGHPDHPNPIKGGALTADGAGGLRFDKRMAAPALAGLERKPDIVIALPEGRLQAISIGALQRAASMAVGGLAPIDDELTLGLGGVIGGRESCAITCVVAIDDERHMVFFWAEANAARGLLEGLQRERVSLGLRPLPRIEDLDAGAEAIDRAERLEQYLERLDSELQTQTELLRRIAAALQGHAGGMA